MASTAMQQRAQGAARVREAERDTRIQLAAALRVAYHLGWNRTINNHISARLPDEPASFVMNPQGLGWHEVTASSLIKSDFHGNDLSPSEYRLAPAGRNFHSAILAARPDLACVVHIHPRAAVVVSAMQEGLMHVDQNSAMLYGRVAYHDYEGLADQPNEGARILADLGERQLMIMRNHGALTVGRTIGEAFHNMVQLVEACETQIALMATGGTIRHLSREVCEHTLAQVAERRQGAPGGTLDWRMYLRLAERLDPGFRD